MAEQESWTSRIGFIFAAVGSAVGLGNVWSFPFQTASNGGAAFIVVYLVAVFVIGFPAILVEFVIGRRTKRNPVDAFADLGFGSWAIAGALGAVTSFATLAFYSVIGGWVLSYIVGRSPARTSATPRRTSVRWLRVRSPSRPMLCSWG